MNSQIIPIIDTPNQLINTSLGGQQCTINLYQKSTGLFCDVNVNNVLIISGVICQNLNRIVRDSYLGFIGDLYFFDTQGLSDPASPGIGTRYLLKYLTS
jgi:hypothetical protein